MKFSSFITVIFSLLLISLFVYFFSDTQANLSPYDTPLTHAETLYETDAKPILDKRCVVCHACYDAPCQLKLGSFQGVARGASKAPVYKGDRLLAADPSRLFEDASSISEWRHKDFFPVLNEVALNAQNNVSNSLLVKLLEQKQAMVEDDNKKLDDSYDLALDREWQCPSLEEYPDYLQEHPNWGMPYGLPKLTASEHATLVNWVEQGAATKGRLPISATQQGEIDKWEAFLNDASLKHQLTARYLYEHFFIAHFYFANDNNEPPRFFRLYRSATPPGKPLKIIATRRPFSDPKVKRVYYRFAPVQETIVHKTHMPFKLSDERLAEYQQWFIEPDYQVSQLPGYQPEQASNPFVTFEALPINARYRFMLSEAQYTIMQFIKGPVCRGQIALNVINDHFWVFFAEPSLDILEHQERFLSQTRHQITLPAEADSNASPTNWLLYAEQEKDYIAAKTAFLNKTLNRSLPLDLSLIWDGDGNNDNAALTVFRHFDAATVVKGLVGEQPQTAWIITYPLFERIHYLLVAGYDVYGNLGHQLNSRMYMDFLRMEGEFHFLSLLPKQSRDDTWQSWYQGMVSPVEKYMASANLLKGDSKVNYSSNDPLSELYLKLQQHVALAISHAHDLDRGFDTQVVLDGLNKLNKMQGKHLALLPQASFLRVYDPASEQGHFYSMLRNNAYSNISHIVAEQARREPERDTLTVGYGFMSSHPNAFFNVAIEQFPAFVEQIGQLSGDKDLEALFDQYGVRRTSPNFWHYADQLHQRFAEQAPIEFGYFDFNRLENL